MGSDIFVFHGYVEFFLEGKWVKATPAFNKELCHLHRVAPLDFNGREDSVFQAFNQDNEAFMEYVEDLGAYADIPVDEIVAGWEKTYGTDRVRGWIQEFETRGSVAERDFYQEDVFKAPA
jgi:hypothetical protein